MTSRPAELQKAVVARLVGDAAVKKLVAPSASGPAVFAMRQAFDQVFPRVLIETPQTVGPRDVKVDELFVTLHAYASGADATLVAGDLANAVREALESAPLALPGFEVVTMTFEGATPVGDPDITVEHVVSTFRFLVGLPA